MAISDICLMFEMINANVNFIIFIVLNRKFYNIWMRLFCRCTVPLFKMVSVRSAAATSRDTTETSIKTRDHRALKANLSTGNGSGVFDKNSLAAQEESSVDATAEDGGNANPSFVQE
ncbi:hypothetical protein DPMN_091321 [Dreissena polymorpha]|uniref:Uncharacterized protein n=1 Tax=Dreissena polymorpha TaxID=45954 RepID=A0A9D4L1V7_DREPO|nr:hypothetical protein DPMN_091321 [Dreissena polymorpha]